MVSCQIEESEGWNSDKFKEEAAQTFNLVFHKYNHRVRPPQPFIEITVDISLRHIRHLDLPKQELQTVLDLEMSWNDFRLQWYPVKVKQISVNISNIWSPDIVYTNSVAATQVLYPSSVMIGHRGNVKWTRKEVVTTLCPTQPGSLTQNCAIMLGFMSNSRNDQTDRFFSNLSSFSLPVNFVNHEWAIVDTELDLDVDNITTRASTVEMNLWLQRRKQVTDNQIIDEKKNEGELEELTSKSCSDPDELNDGNKNEAKNIKFSVPLMGMVMYASCLFRAFLLHR